MLGIPESQQDRLDLVLSAQGESQYVRGNNEKIILQGDL